MTPGNPRSRWPWLIVGVLASAVLVSQLFEIRPGDPRPLGGAEEIEALASRGDLGVIFILIDTLRASRLGAYGYERDTSPSLDYLAGSGVRFARHLAQSSWTKCSMASLWTGLNPDRSGVRRFDDAIPEEAVLPAEIFREAGYRTTAVYRNGWVAPNFGFAQGFELYIKPVADAVSGDIRRENPHIELQGTDRGSIDSAIEFLRAQGEEPFLLYLHLMDVHQYVYDGRSALFGTTYSDVYDNSIRHEDGMVGRLLNYLAKRGLLDRTLVVISSDHGEAFRERGYEGHAKHVYPESTEVPLIVSFPFRLSGGAVVEARSRNIDVWPTVLDLVGLPPLPESDGESLVPAILASVRGETDPAPPRIAASYLDRTWGRPQTDPLPTVAIAEGDHRFVYEASPDEDGLPLEQLFDAGEDPTELENVIDVQPERAAELRAHAERLLAAKETPWGVDSEKVVIDEMQLNQLRALGYSIR